MLNTIIFKLSRSPFIIFGYSGSFISNLLIKPSFSCAYLRFLDIFYFKVRVQIVNLTKGFTKTQQLSCFKM